MARSGSSARGATPFRGGQGGSSPFRHADLPAVTLAPAAFERALARAREDDADRDEIAYLEERRRPYDHEWFVVDPMFTSKDAVEHLIRHLRKLHVATSAPLRDATAEAMIEGVIRASDPRRIVRDDSAATRIPALHNAWLAVDASAADVIHARSQLVHEHPVVDEIDAASVVRQAANVLARYPRVIALERRLDSAHRELEYTLLDVSVRDLAPKLASIAPEAFTSTASREYAALLTDDGGRPVCAVRVVGDSGESDTIDSTVGAIALANFSDAYTTPLLRLRTSPAFLDAGA